MRFKAAFFLLFTVLVNTICLAQAPPSSSESLASSSPLEAAAQALPLLSPLDQTARITSALSAPLRRGRKGLVTADSDLKPVDQPAPVSGAVADEKVAVTSKETAASPANSEAVRSNAELREVVTEPVIIRFNPAGSVSDSADETAKLRYEFVTATPRPRSRFAFLKAIFPKRLKTIWRRGAHQTVSLQAPSGAASIIPATVRQFPQVTQLSDSSASALPARTSPRQSAIQHLFRFSSLNLSNRCGLSGSCCFSGAVREKNRKTGSGLVNPDYQDYPAATQTVI